MIDIEVVDRRNNNYLPLLFFLLGGFLLTLKNIFYNIGMIKINSIFYKDIDKLLIKDEKGILFNLNPRSLLNNNNFISNNNIVYEYNHSNLTFDYKYNNIDLTLFDKLSMNNNMLDSYFINYDLFYNKYELLSENIDKSSILNNQYNNNGASFINKHDFKDTDFVLNVLSSDIYDSNYLLIIPEWNTAVSRVTQIAGIGDVLYTVYHSYIYIVSIILLLGMVGAIILTAEHKHYTKIFTVEIPDPFIMNNNDMPKNSSIFFPFILIIVFLFKFIYKNFNSINLNWFISPFVRMSMAGGNILNPICIADGRRNKSDKVKSHIICLSGIGIYPFFDILNYENQYSEEIAGTLLYYVISNIIIGLLLLVINSSFSLSVKYLEKGGGFECGFTSFVQTRERFNIIFYRVSLLFLIFDLEIILAFPYPAIYQKDENMSKNNVLAFLYILVVGFIYELKEGALNIVKTPHLTDFKFE